MQFSFCLEGHYHIFYVPHQAIKSFVAKGSLPVSLFWAGQMAVVVAVQWNAHNQGLRYISYQQNLFILRHISYPKCVLWRPVFYCCEKLLRLCPSQLNFISWSLLVSLLIWRNTMPKSCAVDYTIGVSSNDPMELGTSMRQIDLKDRKGTESHFWFERYKKQANFMLLYQNFGENDTLVPPYSQTFFVHWLKCKYMRHTTT